MIKMMGRILRNSQFISPHSTPLEHHHMFYFIAVYILLSYSIKINCSCERIRVRTSASAPPPQIWACHMLLSSFFCCRGTMAVLGKIPGKELVHFGAGIMLVTILLCYAIAVGEGHVKPWLPTISMCGENPPEQYFFRYGILTGAQLLVVLAWYVYVADFPFSGDLLNVTMGVIAGVCLGIVAVVASNEDNSVHSCECFCVSLRVCVCVCVCARLTYFYEFFAIFSVCAITFFVLEDLLVLRITLQGRGTLSQTSLSIKTICTGLIWLSSIGKCILSFSHTHPHTLTHTHTLTNTHTHTHTHTLSHTHTLKSCLLP